ncbi:MAG TPA: chloride channel protein [Puia sp.]|nr:chloride channel protein [Puia sp.]
MSSTIPLSVSLSGLHQRNRDLKDAPVNKRVFYLSLQSVFNAILIGFIAKGLVFLIDGITNLFFHGKLSFLPASPADNHLGWFVMFVPVVGGIIVGLMARYGSRSIAGHGIPEAMEKIIVDESRIPPAITFLKPLSAAISIGTGGPFGAEGPIIATGGAFGSFTGQVMHISSSERKIILAAGACSGMAAIFGTPLAAVMLAIELLLFEFSPRSIIPVATGCITGAGMHIFLFGSQPVFSMPDLPAVSGSALLIYIILGLATGVVASGISRSVYVIEDLFEKIPVHWMWFPAIGAIVIGVTGYFAPYTMGVGYDNIRNLLTGKLPLTILFSLFLLKYISWSVSLGSGTSGGTLAPLFTIGGAFGALAGTLILYLYPNAPVNIALASLIGMASMFAGASRALLTSILFAMETTGQANALLPLLGACIAAYFISFFLMESSIMTEKIKRRGVHAPDTYHPDVLQSVPVAGFLSEAKSADTLLPHIYDTDDLGFAAEMMGKYHLQKLLVIKENGGREIAGIIQAASILKYYSEQKQKDHAYESPGKTKRVMVRGRQIFKINKNRLH